MVCKYCGAEMPVFAVFCGQCGKAQPEEPAAHPKPVNVAGGNTDYVTPMEENGKLTCPVCGAKGQPKGRKRCWQCGIPFAEGVSTKTPQAINPPTSVPIPAQPPVPISFSHVAEKPQDANYEKYKEVSRIGTSKWLLFVTLVLSIIISIAVLFPVCMLIKKPLYFYDAERTTTTALVASGIILGPLFIVVFLIAHNVRHWSLLWLSLIAHFLTAIGTLSAMIQIRNGYISPSPVATFSCWFAICAAVVNAILIIIGLARIHKNVASLKSYEQNEPSHLPKEKANSIDRIKGLLICALVLSIIASFTSALLPVCTFTGYGQRQVNGYIFSVDAFTTVFALAGIILGPILLMLFLFCKDSRRWALLWGSMFAHSLTAAAKAAAFITFREEHPYSFEAIPAGWIGFSISIAVLFILLAAISCIKNQVQYLKMHMK